MTIQDGIAATTPAIATGADIQTDYARAFEAYSGNRLGEALAILDGAVRRHRGTPGSSRLHSLFGVTLKAAGQFEPAVAQFERAVALEPGNVGSHYNLGNALLQMRRYEAAVARYRHMLTLAPEFPEGRNNLGNALLGLNRFEEAAAEFRHAVAARPEFGEAHYNAGSALLRLQKWEDAGVHFEKVLEQQPHHAVTLMILSDIRSLQGRMSEAARHFEYAVMLDSNVALARFQHALSQTPNSPDAHCDLAIVLEDLGRKEEACRHYEQAMVIDPNFVRAKLGITMAQLPAIYTSEEQIIERRAAYSARLADLEAACEEPAQLRGIVEVRAKTEPFYLPYQGMNDRDLQARYGSLLCRAIAKRLPQATLPPPPGPNEKVRVGIVSAFFSHHSNWKIPIRGWLSQLDRERFELFGYHTKTYSDAETEIAKSLCARFVQGKANMEEWRAEILSDAPHVLIYPEIGMDPTAAHIAAQRLAPVQCNSWGHPNTSGLPTLDYYLSSALMEPPDGQDYYTEELVRLPNLSIYYEPMSFAPQVVTRAELGLREDATVYWSGQTIIKYLPQYDHVFARIAERVGNCQFLFLEMRKAVQVTEIFKARLQAAFGAVGLKAEDYCVFLPFMASDRFAGTLAAADVFLDSLGWSGCNSSLEGLPSNLPIVTLRGKTMRARHSAAILDMMGITDSIADDIDTYVDLAVRVARDPEWLAGLRARIAENKHLVYRDRACITALEDFLDRAARTPR